MRISKRTRKKVCIEEAKFGMYANIQCGAKSRTQYILYVADVTFQYMHTCMVQMSVDIILQHSSIVQDSHSYIHELLRTRKLSPCSICTLHICRYTTHNNAMSAEIQLHAHNPKWIELCSICSYIYMFLRRVGVEAFIFYVGIE